MYYRTLEPTSAFKAGFVERFAYVVVRRKAIELGREGHSDVTFTEHLADGFACVPVQQVVGADDHHAAPVVLEKMLQKEVGQLAERTEGARQRRVGNFVVEVWISGHPRDKRYIEERRHLRHSPTSCTATTRSHIVIYKMAKTNAAAADPKVADAQL